MGKAIYSPEAMESAIRKLRAEAGRHDVQPHHIAAEMLEAARRHDDIEGMKFWRAVWIKIMSDEYIGTQPKAGASRRRPLPAQTESAKEP